MGVVYRDDAETLMSNPDTPKFTLRFHKAGNHELLGLLADRYGMSKNQLAEDMLERELRAAALLFERDLTGTLKLLRGYRRDEHLMSAIDDIARAEAHESDPIVTTVAAKRSSGDAYGIADVFAA